MRSILVLVSFRNHAEAKRICRSLLQRRLIVCATITSANSIYQWRGNVEEAKEALVFLKTSETKWKAVRREIEKLHSYETPCITKLQVNENKRCRAWLQHALK